MNYLTEQKFFSHLAVGQRQRQEGNYSASEFYFQRAQVAADSDPDSSVSDKALVLQHLATLYSESGRTDEAEEIYKRICEMWQKARGDDHPAVALCLEVLAEMCRSQGRITEAQTIKARARAIWDKVMSKDGRTQKSGVAV